MIFKGCKDFAIFSSTECELTQLSSKILRALKPSSKLFFCFITGFCLVWPKSHTSSILWAFFILFRLTRIFGGGDITVLNQMYHAKKKKSHKHGKLVQVTHKAAHKFQRPYNSALTGAWVDKKRRKLLDCQSLITLPAPFVSIPRYQPQCVVAQLARIFYTCSVVNNWVETLVLWSFTSCNRPKKETKEYGADRIGPASVNFERQNLWSKKESKAPDEIQWLSLLL